MKELRKEAIESLLKEGAKKMIRTELMLERLSGMKPEEEEQQEQVKQAFAQQQANKAQLEKEIKRLMELRDENR